MKDINEEIDHVLALAKAGIVRAIPMDVMHAIEERYGGKPKSYSCGGCVMQYLKKIIKINEL